MQAEDIISQAVTIAGLGSHRRCTPLGFGEVNRSFKLSYDDGKEYVIRITKRKRRDTLLKEGRALGLLDKVAPGRIPQLVFFDPEHLVDEHMWIIESYVSGSPVVHLNIEQFRSLGQLLAKVHRITNGEKGLDLWQHFLLSCRFFGNETTLLNHEDATMRELIQASKRYMAEYQSTLEAVQLSLIHGDATASNSLVSGDIASLIDWEFASFSDPMREFSAIYYDDLETNQGKWKIHIKPEEKTALFSGYQAGGGVINLDRIDFWMNFDKLCTATFLYWRIHQSEEEASKTQLEQYQFDLTALLRSLSRSLLAAASE